MIRNAWRSPVSPFLKKKLLAVLLCALVPLSGALAAVLLTRPTLAAGETPGTPAYYDARLEDAKQAVHWLAIGTHGGVAVTNPGPWKLDLNPAICSAPWNGGSAVPAVGTGAAGDPYQVSTAEQLRYCITSFKSFKLTKDIDLGGYQGWNWNYGAASATAYTADGNGHTVYNFYSSASLTGNSLFGAHSNLTVQNLRISNSYVNSGGGTGAAIVLAGSSVLNSVISNCAVENSLLYSNTLGVAIFSGYCSKILIENSYAINSHAVCLVASGTKSCCSIIANNAGTEVTIRNTFAIECTLVGNKGHNGGFVSCGSNFIVENCFSDINVYGNMDAGAFGGVAHGAATAGLMGTHQFVNCYASGKVEGTSDLGAFMGTAATWGSSIVGITTTRCYSTAAVGIVSNAVRMGGMFGSMRSASDTLGGNTLELTCTDCYAAGEIGSLDTDVSAGRGAPDQNTGGFYGINNSDGGTKTYTNCYYDKQTTAMREWETGPTQDGGAGDVAGIKGVLTTTTVKAGTGLTAAPGAAGPASFSGFTDNSQWTFEPGHYPQLKVFAQPEDFIGTSSEFKNTNWMSRQELFNLIKAYSRASAATVHLETWDQLSDKPKTYDTVRDAVLNFPLTTGGSIAWSRVGSGATLANGTGNTSPWGGVPVLEIVKPGTGYGAKWLAHKLAPGVEWLRATVTIGNQTGTRALRVLPTRGLQAGPNASVERGEEAYDHRVGVNLAYSTAALMAVNPNNITPGSWTTTDTTGYDTGVMAADSAVALRATPIIGTDSNGSPVLAAESLELSDDTGEDINKWLNGTANMDLIAGRYLFEYTWTFDDGRYMQDRKILQVRGQPTAEKNAYVYPGGVETKANGLINAPVAVKKGDILKYEISVTNPGPGLPPTVPNPVFMDPLDPAVYAPQNISFINGSFEEPDTRETEMIPTENPWGQPHGANPNGAYYHYSQVPGWYSVPTNPSDIGNAFCWCIQYFCSYNTGTGQWGSEPFPDGEQFAELNASYASRLYQICETVPGTKIYWELSHEACQDRSGTPHTGSPPGSGSTSSTDQLNVYIYATQDTTPGLDGKPVGDSSGNLQPPPPGATKWQLVTMVGERWKRYSDVYQVPPGQTSTTLAFESPGSYSGLPSFGNYLDNIRLYTNSFLTMDLSHDAAGNKADIGQAVTYALEIENIGESDASDIVVTQVLPAGVDFVPGVLVNDIALAGANYDYDEPTRTLTVRVGVNLLGVGSFSAGMGQSCVVNFQVIPNGEVIAENMMYQTQAQVHYEDAGYESDHNDYSNYSNVASFALEILQYATITDQLPAGLTYDNVHTDDGGTFVINDQTCTWTWDNMPAGVVTVTVWVKVTEGYVLYDNKALVDVRFALPFETNHTYHRGPAQKDAHVNSDGVDNGTDENPVPAKRSDIVHYEITVGKPAKQIPAVPSPVFPDAPKANPYQKVTFLNGSFEQGGTAMIPMALVPGWSTRPTSAADDSNANAFVIEIYPPSTYWGAGATAPDGSLVAELNAYVPGTLYQDCVTVPGTKVYYEFYHRGRSGVDTMDFYLYGVPNTSVLTTPGRDGFVIPYIKRCIDGQTAWGRHTGSYTVPAGQTLTRFAYQSVSSTGPSAGPAWGNLLDAIRLYTQSFLTLTQTQVTPLGGLGGSIVEVGDVVTHTIRVENEGESDASLAVLTITLPAGAELVPGSVVNAVLGSYDPGTRELVLYAGGGATTSKGGMIKGTGSFSSDCQPFYDVEFQVKITDTAVAQNRLYETQARVDYQDRNHDDDNHEIGEVIDYYWNVSNIACYGLQEETYVNYPFTVTDVIPAGMTIVPGTIKITQGGVEVDDGSATYPAQEITWDLSALPAGQYVLKVDVEVTENCSFFGNDLYDNKATVHVFGADVDSNHTYHAFAAYLLHVRQVVLNPVSGAERPPMGYLSLANNGVLLPATCVSGPDLPLGPYTTYELLANNDPEYYVRLAVPQNYAYDGFIRDQTGNHVSTGRTLPPPAPGGVGNGYILLDYSGTAELWLTLYITTHSNPKDHSSDYATNDFGTVEA